MGVDIHISLYTSDKVLIQDEILEGVRCSEWFYSLQYGDDPIYKHFPRYYFSKEDSIPAVIKELKDDSSIYGITYLTIKDYYDWFNEYKPHIKAGWCTTYTKWLMDNKHYIPTLDEDIFTEKDVLDLDSDDYVFTSYEDIYDLSLELFKELNKLNAKDQDILIFYFDR